MSKSLLFPIILLSSLVIRILVTGATVGDALGLIALSGMYSYFTFLETKKQIPVNKEILDRVIYLEEQLKETKGKVGALGISASQFRR